MQGKGFNSFASNMIKLSVSETKWSCLLARTRALILYISIWKFDFGPETLPGLSRNGPQVFIYPTFSGIFVCGPLQSFVFWGRRSWFCPCVIGWFWPTLYFLCETSTWHLDSCPPENTWYGVILWVLRVLGQSFNQSARIVFTRAFCGCYAVLTSPKEGETAVYGYNPVLFWVLSVSCWCLAELIFT